MRGIKAAYFYHMGSLAFGSMIIAVLQLIYIIFILPNEQAQKFDDNNPVRKASQKVCKCCVQCFENICDYINTQAYAYMAVSGDSFCKSAWNGFLLNLKHALKFSFANFLARCFIFIGKLSLVVINCLSLFLIMKHITKDYDEINSLAAPVALVGTFTFITASIFLSLFDEAVLALLTCLCVDTDLNGSPKFGPPTFYDGMKIFGSESVSKVGTRIE